MSNSILLLSSLPICAAFRSKSSGKYLRYSSNGGEGANGGQHLQLTGDDADKNPLTRFFVEKSSKNDGLVHIRSYDNKYWVAEQQQGNEWWIAGSADKQEEEVFQLKPVEGDPMTVRLFTFLPSLTDVPFSNCQQYYW